MALRDMVKRSEDATLDQSKRAFHGVRGDFQTVRTDAAVFLGGMVDAGVLEVLLQALVTVAVISVNDCSVSDVGLNGSAQVTTLQASIQDITRQTERTNSERQALSKQAEENKDLLSIIRQELSQETATRKAMMIEIETQVASVEQVRNMQNAELHRMLSIIWPKELGMYPQGPHVHPAISNRNLKE